MVKREGISFRNKTLKVLLIKKMVLKVFFFLLIKKVLLIAD